MKFSIVPLDKSHNKKDFYCSNELLTNYLHKQAKQDVNKKIAVCFVLIDEKENVIGYYTLSSASASKNQLPPNLAKRIPYDDVPVTLLGRLAIDQSIMGKGWGGRLLIDALKRSLKVSQTQIGSSAIAVDPIDETAVSFYENYGFIQAPDSKKMFLPMQTIAKLFND